MNGGTTDPPASKRRSRVLVADDEDALRRAIIRALDDAGFEVEGAADGAAAVQAVAERNFDAVVTDVRMPGASGIELLRRVRERDLEAAVLLITGAPDVQSAAEAVRYGASEYLVKPVPLAQLVGAVRKSLALTQLARVKRESLRVLGTGLPEAADLAGLDVTLDRALETMWVAYHPIVHVGTRSLFAYEALLRSAETSLPHPGAVLDAAVRLGRLDEVGRSVRDLAPRPLTERGDAETLLFVNVHANDLRDDTLLARTSQLAAMAPRVVLEITERAAFADVADARQRVAQLREMGFRIAIDDLGAGYAGLSSFAQLEPEFVKLDLSLIRDIEKHTVKQKVVRSMVEVCRDLGIAVVSEGIETEAERDTVLGLGCDLLQGFLFARPGPPFPPVSW